MDGVKPANVVVVRSSTFAPTITNEHQGRPRFDTALFREEMAELSDRLPDRLYVVTWCDLCLQVCT